MKTNNVFINPLTDFGFKRVFASEENKDILIAFLNDCISDHVGVIREIRFLPTEHIGLAEAEKKLIFDIYCTNERGQRFIIEMQRARQDYFADRVITYISRIISNEASRGARRYDIPPVYSFNILDYNAPEFMGREEYFWAVHLKDNQNRIFSKKIILFFMELTKFAAQFPDERSPAYKWGYALKHMSGMSLKDMPEEAGEFRKLFEVCQMSRLTTMEKNDYEKSIFEYEDVQDALECMHRHSLQEGYEQGMQQGMQQGKEEALIQTARNFLNLGVSLADVAKATGLSEEEILAHVGNAGENLGR